MCWSNYPNKNHENMKRKSKEKLKFKKKIVKVPTYPVIYSLTVNDR